MIYIALIMVGFAGGLVVGGAVAAFFTALGVVTRIVEIGKTKRYLYLYKISILAGTVTSALLYFFSFKVKGSSYILIFIGLFMGIFVGMIASALAEVLDVIPLIASSLNIGKWIYIIIFSIIIGKIVGSLIYWIVPGFY